VILIHREGHEGHEVEFEELSNQVIGCAINVHRELGPGLLESAYEACLAYELDVARLDYVRQVEISVGYRGQDIGVGYRADIIVEGRLLLELKSVERLERIHEAQMLTYLKLAGLDTGLLINFNSELLRKGLKRFVL